MARQIDQGWPSVGTAYGVTNFQYDSAAVRDRLEITVPPAHTLPAHAAMSPPFGVSFANEQAWAEQHTDLPAQVFLSVGAGEQSPGQGRLNENMPDVVLAKPRQVENVRKLVPRFKTRGYPGLHIDHSVFSDEYHLTVFPAAISRGLRSLFSDAKEVS